MFSRKRIARLEQDVKLLKADNDRLRAMLEYHRLVDLGHGERLTALELGHVRPLERMAQ